MTWRSHQQKFLDLCEAIASHRSKSRHLVAAVTPGGGKSALPVIAAATLLPAIASRICWVVPRVALQQQGIEAFQSPLFRSLLGHRLEVGDRPGVGSGCVTTYQAIACNREEYRAMFERDRTILVLDEPHHAPEGSEWAIALEPLVNSAALLIQMSGTFQRHDGRPVAFLPYQRRQGVQVFEPACYPSAIEYSRVEALREKAVIRAEFRWFDIGATWMVDGEQQQSLFSLAEADDEAAVKFGIYITLKTNATLPILMTCYKDWQNYRQFNPSSKLLVVAPSISSARAFYDELKAAGAQRMDIAVSADSLKAQRAIGRYKKTRGSDCLDILITVAMAYEGLDVPPISHIALLTHIRSAPWIEQAVTRGTRVYWGEGALPYDDQTAYIYCLHDMLMERCVQRIIDEQTVAIAALPTEKSEDGGLEPPAERKPPETSLVQLLDSTVTLTAATDLEGCSLDPTELGLLQVLARVSGTTEETLRSMPVVYVKNQFQLHARAIAAAQSDPHLQPVAVVPPPTARMTLDSCMSDADLRREITNLTNQLDKEKAWQPGTTNKMARRQFGKSRRHMTGSELRRVEGWLRSQIRSGG